MKHLTKTALPLAILIIVSLVIAACAPAAAPTPTPKPKAPAAAPTKAPAPKPTPPPAPTPTPKPKALAPYKIGVVLALSGYYTGIGVPARDGAVALANEINAAGGINGRKLQLIIEDDGTDESKAVLAVKKLINQDKVLAIVGPTGTGLSMAAIPIVEKAKVPMFAVGAGDVLVKPVKKWVFKFVSGETKNHAENYRYLKSKGVKKLALLYVSNAYGKGSAAYVRKTAPKEGFELVVDETYAPKDQDFAPQLTKVRASGAEGLIVEDASVATALLAKQMKSLGIKIPWTGPYGMIGPANVKAAGSAFDGLVVPAPKVYVADQLPDTDRQKKVALQFIAAYKKTTGKDVNPMGMHGWDPILVIAEALKRTNPDPANLAEARAKIRDAVEGLKNFPAVVSILNLSPTDHEGMPPGWAALVELRGGKFYMVK
jgi:branched-chain amino acid transport system substrate-binding protein